MISYRVSTLLQHNVNLNYIIYNIKLKYVCRQKKYVEYLQPIQNLVVQIPNFLDDLTVWFQQRGRLDFNLLKQR